MTDTPNPQRHGQQLVWTFAEFGVTISLDRWKEERGGLSAECTVRKGSGLLSQARFNLSSLGARRTWTKELQAKTAALTPPLPWGLLLERVCTEALADQRTAEPVGPLMPAAKPLSVPWRLFPLVHEGVATMLFGPGDLGKSYFALLTAMVVETGGPYLGLNAVNGRALYLDWETDRAINEERADRIRRGHPELRDAEPLYRQCTGSLADELTEIQALIMEHRVQYVILDSLALASGADLMATDTAIRFFRALRTLKLPMLIIAHPPKNAEQQTVYGNAFFTYLSRCVWQIEGEGDGAFALYHRKKNLGPRQQPMGYRMHFSDDAVTFEAIPTDELGTVPESSDSRQAVEDCLLEGPKAVSEIVAASGFTESAVRSILHRGKGRRYLKLNSGKWALVKL